MTAILTLSAQSHPYHWGGRVYPEIGQWLRSHIEADFKHRADSRRVLPVSTMLGDVGLLWTDGVNTFCTLYDEETREIEMGLSYVDHPEQLSQAPHFLLSPGNIGINNKKMCLVDNPAHSVTVEQLGNYKMLVVRDAQGVPLNAYYAITIDEYNNGYRHIFMHYLLLGNYSTPAGSNVVFGPKMKFYSGNDYDVDPGFFDYYITPDFSTLYICYGEGRVSHGDPSSPNYGKMPGGGGAAAIMGPMEWNVVPNVDGLQVTVTTDEKFVDHNPRIDEHTQLTKLACPYAGLNGKWAFASVIPLTAPMLHLFPKQVLTLMRAEIYARHGDTFGNADTQRYFDAQPWYKRSNRTIKLTDLERFNYALIKSVENSMK